MIRKQTRGCHSASSIYVLQLAETQPRLALLVEQLAQIGSNVQRWPSLVPPTQLSQQADQVYIVYHES